MQLAKSIPSCVADDDDINRSILTVVCNLTRAIMRKKDDLETLHEGSGLHMYMGRKELRVIRCCIRNACEENQKNSMAMPSIMIAVDNDGERQAPMGGGGRHNYFNNYVVTTSTHVTNGSLLFLTQQRTDVNTFLGRFKDRGW